MHTSLATCPGTGDTANEDWAITTPELVIMLDGVTVPPDMSTGCHHGTLWFVRQLGTRILTNLAGRPEINLTSSVKQAIAGVAAAHADTCDIDHLGTPSATVAILREHREGPSTWIDYFVLADSSIVVDTATGLEVVSDTRVQAMPTEQIAQQRSFRNQPDGYWVAAGAPEAASHGLAGELTGVRRAAVLTDGAARAIDVFHHMDWLAAFDLMQNHGPRELLSQVRSVEASDPDGERWPRFKQSDDASAALCLFDQQEGAA